MIIQIKNKHQIVAAMTYAGNRGTTATQVKKLRSKSAGDFHKAYTTIAKQNINSIVVSEDGKLVPTFNFVEVNDTARMVLTKAGGAFMINWEMLSVQNARDKNSVGRKSASKGSSVAAGSSASEVSNIGNGLHNVGSSKGAIL